MASITSVISFLILLLATYSYSAPTVTPEYEFTTGTMLVEHQTPATLILMKNPGSVSVSNIQKPRSFNGLDSEELTTIESEKRGLTESSEESSTIDPVRREFNEFSPSTVEPVKRGLTESSEESSTIDPVKREFDEYSFSTVEPIKRGLTESSEESSTIDPVKREFDESSFSTVAPVKRGFFKYSTPDMETATTFNGRAIGEEGVESFDLTTPFYEEQPEGEGHSEPSSSADKQAVQSGLLDDESTVAYPTKSKQTIFRPLNQQVKTIVETKKNSALSNEGLTESKITVITNGESLSEGHKH